ncbi:MAG: hypothetical protein J1F33_04685 [Clostridiales bacterium]|nr:hypothetical protein [Clostridiales bacterium]
MARETKTVQCYPDDKIVNEKISQYEAFGWELINNQRCQEFDGQSRDIYDGSTVNHYSTFNKLTFTRDKSEPWYGEVVKLESEFEMLMDKKPSRPYERNISGVAIFFGVFLSLCSLGPIITGISVGSAGLALIGLVPIGIAVILFVTQGMKKKRNNEDYLVYYSQLKKWEANEKAEADEIIKKARELVENT